MTKDDRPFQEPGLEQIIDALRRAGWLLEQETDAVLLNREFSTTIGAAFPDPDDASKSREIDVMAYKRIYTNDELRMSAAIRCLIECKQTSNPYIVIGKPTIGRDQTKPRQEEVYVYDRVLVPYLGESQHGGRQYHYVDARRYLGLQELSNAPWNHGFLANQMTRLERKHEWVADNRGIFDSLVVPLAKAIQYYRKKLRSANSNFNSTYGWSSIEFIYPMIVTSSSLYKLDVSLESYRPEAADWVPMVRELRSETLDGRFVMDVVTSNGLEKYLDGHVEPFASELRELVEADPKRFVTQQDEAYREIG